MHSHFVKKFLKETLHFSAGCWLFLKKWNNEGVYYSPHIILTPPIEVYFPHKCKKKFGPHKILANFQIKSPHYNGRSRNQEVPVFFRTRDMHDLWELLRDTIRSKMYALLFLFKDSFIIIIGIINIYYYYYLEFYIVPH